MEQVRKDIIDKIVSNIPNNMKPTEFIMRTLNISKGSAYRRLNAMLPFSYDEIVLLANKMNFSVDEVICSTSKKKFIFEYDGYFINNIINFILKTLSTFYDKMLMEQKMKKRRILSTANNLWFIHTLHFDNLFKFFYYKFLQQYDISHLKDKMENIDIPQSIIDIKIKLAELLLVLDNTYRTSIIDRHIFLNTIHEIQYYYRRNLINDDELKAIANDMRDLLTIIEKVITENKYNGDSNLYFLAERNIYTNSVSIETDAQVYALTFHNEIYPIVCYDQELSRAHQHYLELHKKQSSLISSSNEQLQIAFIDKQYEYIRNLAENKDLRLYTDF